MVGESGGGTQGMVFGKWGRDGVGDVGGDVFVENLGVPVFTNHFFIILVVQVFKI